MIDSNSSAEIISSNQDLLIQILIRLPAKPLIRFKSVSKPWFSLISCRQFCSLHTLQNPNKTTSGLFLRKSFQEFQLLSYENSKNSKSVPPFTSLDFTNDPAGIKILQSCNGLLLCSSLFTMGTTRRYYIYNPTTKQFSTLPTILDATSSTILGMNLEFDPSISFHYKVICIRSMPASIYYHQIVEYYSQVGSWHVRGSPFVAPHDIVFDNGVFWNGAMHWIGTAGNVMCYNFDRECFLSMPKHPFLEERGKKKCRYFGESGGHLFLIEFYGSCASHFKVFEMEKDSSKWDFKYQVDLSHVLQEFPEMVRSHHAFVVLCLVGGDGEDGSPLVLLHIPGKVICYDLKEKTCRKVYELGICGNGNKGSLQFGWFDAYPFVESLACV